MKTRKGGQMIRCSVCGEQAIEVIHRPHVPFADGYGNVTLSCYNCHSEDYEAAKQLLGVLND